METFTLNPKSISLRELFGYLNPHNMTWTDGLLAQAMRKFAKDLEHELDHDSEVKIISSSFNNIERSWIELQDQKNLESEGEQRNGKIGLDKGSDFI